VRAINVDDGSIRETRFVRATVYRVKSNNDRRLVTPGRCWIAEKKKIVPEIVVSGTWGWANDRLTFLTAKLLNAWKRKKKLPSDNRSQNLLFSERVSRF